MGTGEDELIIHRQRLLIDNMLDMVSIINPEGIIEYISPSIINILGYEPEMLVGHSFADIIHPQDLNPAATAFSTAVEAAIQTREETRCRHADGHYLWLDSVVNPVADDSGMVKAITIASRDITARKKAEQYLLDERQKLYSLLDGLPAFVYLQNTDYSMSYYNQKFSQLFGDPGGRPCFNVVNGFEQPCESCPAFRVFETNRPEVWEWSSRDDKTYQMYAYPFSDIDGTPLVLGLGIDITDRKQAEIALRLSEERFSKAFKAIPCAMSIHRLWDEKIIDVNNSFLTGLGYGRSEVIGSTTSKLKFWVEPNNYPQIIAKIHQNQGMVSNHEIKFYTRSGEERIGLLSAEIIELNNEPCILMAVNDITEIRHFEKEMAHLDRLNLIAQMAAGIGHEIRNPMTTVRGLLQLLCYKEGQAEYKDYYDLMIGELDRANLIITEYLSLAKNKSINLQPGSLNTIVGAMYPLLSADAIMHNNNILMELGAVPDIMFDDNEIRQLILNLVRNGLEAMPTGGNLTISTFLEDGEVVLSVQDQGSGIMPGVMDKIGTPFFTTKEAGTGLGLPVCYSVVHRHGALIKINTGPKGTNFQVRFKLLELPS